MERFRDPDLARRADAFVLSHVLLGTTLVVGAAAWAPTRRWLTPPNEPRWPRR